MIQRQKQITQFYSLEELNKKPVDILIKETEHHYKKQVEQIVDSVLDTNKTKFILIAGPSSSGKTTTSHILKETLEKRNKYAKVISLDDFFLNREETPVLPNGDKDYDSVNSIDWALFDKCMSELLTQKISTLPVYNFLTGEKEFNDVQTTLLDNEIIIIEGLHALNPIINNFIPHKLSAKVFVCPKTSFHLNNNKELDVFLLRLIRRLIRDVRTRGIEPETTLKLWKNVRAAEDLYVLPFENDADYIVDTTHEYEPCVYKNILDVILVNHKKTVQELLTYLEGFKTITPTKVPSTSLLKEFVG